MNKQLKTEKTICPVKTQLKTEKNNLSSENRIKN